MENSLDSSNSNLNINSRPSRARKKKDFGDFEVDLIDGYDNVLVTSTPLPTKKRESGNSSQISDKASSNLQSPESGSHISNLTSAEDNQDEAFGQQNELLGDERVNVIDELDLQKSGDDASVNIGRLEKEVKVQGRSRGRPRKTELSSNLNKDFDFYCVSSKDLSDHSTGKKLPEGNTKRGRGITQESFHLSSRSLKEDIIEDKRYNEKAEEQFKSDLKTSVELNDKDNEVVKRGPGRPKKVSMDSTSSTKDLINNIDNMNLTNKELDKDIASCSKISVVGSEKEHDRNPDHITKRGRGRPSKKLYHDYSVEEKSLNDTHSDHFDSMQSSECQTSGSMKESDMNDVIEGKRGRGRPKGSFKNNSSLVLKSNVVVEDDNSVSEDDLLGIGSVEHDKNLFNLKEIVKEKRFHRSRPNLHNDIPPSGGINVSDLDLNSSKDVEHGFVSSSISGTLEQVSVEKDCDLRLKNDESKSDFSEELISHRGRGRPRGRPRGKNTFNNFLLNRSNNNTFSQEDDVSSENTTTGKLDESKISEEDCGIDLEKNDSRIRGGGRGRGRGRPRGRPLGAGRGFAGAGSGLSGGGDEKDNTRRQSGRTPKKQKLSLGSESETENDVLSDDDKRDNKIGQAHFIPKKRKLGSGSETEIDINVDDEDCYSTANVVNISSKGRGRGRGRGRPRGRPLGAGRGLGGGDERDNTRWQSGHIPKKRKLSLGSESENEKDGHSGLEDDNEENNQCRQSNVIVKEQKISSGSETENETNDNNEDYCSPTSIVNISTSGRGRGRGRGRPRGRPPGVGRGIAGASSGLGGGDEKNSKKRQSGRIPKKRKLSFESESENELSEGGSDDDDFDTMSALNTSKRGSGRGRGRPRGRGRGRPSGKGRESCSDGSGDEDTTGGNDSFSNSIQSKGKGKTTPASKTTEFKCCHCDNVTKSFPAFTYHVMVKHSLLPSRHCLEGVSNPSVIIARAGYIACQKCGKKFKSSQYYRHHVEWCGREEEMFLCPVCNKQSKAMWKVQHMRDHKLQEQRREERERIENGDMNDAGRLGKKLQRQAAKSALTMISNLDMTDEGSNKPQNAKMLKKKEREERDYDHNDDENDDDDYDDDDDDDDESDINEEEDSGEEESYDDLIEVKTDPEKYSRKPRTLKEFVWRILACYKVDSASAQNAVHFYKELKRTKDLFLFENLVPACLDWAPLGDSERQKYLPSLKHSGLFTSVPKGDEPGQTVSLSFGETANVNGKQFSFTGGPIWAMEWCPLPIDSEHPEVLALVADNHKDPMTGMIKATSGSSLIQFWTLDRERLAKLSFGIAQDSGTVKSMAWCSVGGFSHEMKTKELDQPTGDAHRLKRLGLLAVGCSDSTILIYSIPQICSLFPALSTNGGDSENHENRLKDDGLPAVFRPSPSLKLVLNSLAKASPCLCVSWQGGDQCRYVLGGFGSGRIVMWDIVSTSEFIRVDANTIRPARMFCQQDMSVMSLTWCQSYPKYFISGDYGGAVNIWDKDRPYEPVASVSKQKKGSIRGLCWTTPFHGGYLMGGDKKRILTDDSSYPISKEPFSVSFHGLGMKCADSSDRHTYIYSHPEAVMDLNFQPLHEIIASCDTVGNVVVTLPRLDILRQTRKVISKESHFHTISMGLYKVDLRKKSVSKRGKKSVGNKSAEKDKGDKPTDQSEESITFKVKDELDEDVACSSQTQAIRKTEEHSIAEKERSPAKGDNNDESMDVVYFHECDQNPLELNPVPKDSKKLKIDVKEKDDLLVPNTAAVHRVRLCNSLSEDIWLASGGQMGLLRIDNLKSWVFPHRRDVFNKIKDLLKLKI